MIDREHAQPRMKLKLAYFCSWRIPNKIEQGAVLSRALQILTTPDNGRHQGILLNLLDVSHLMCL